jgi:hypothetical protein
MRFSLFLCLPARKWFFGAKKAIGLCGYKNPYYTLISKWGNLPLKFFAPLKNQSQNTVSDKNFKSLKTRVLGTCLSHGPFYYGLPLYYSGVRGNYSIQYHSHGLKVITL